MKEIYNELKIGDWVESADGFFEITDINGTNWDYVEMYYNEEKDDWCKSEHTGTWTKADLRYLTLERNSFVLK